MVFVLLENSARPASCCTLVYPRSLRLNFVAFFFLFFFNYLIDSHLPQPEILGYVIYNTNIIKKTTSFFSIWTNIYIYRKDSMVHNCCSLIGLSGLS